MSARPAVQLIAVVGGSGAGKGWLVERVCRLMDEHAMRLQLDDFYRDRSHLPMARRARLNYDTPDAIDWKSAERALLDLRAGRSPWIPVYDFATHCRMDGAERTAPPLRPIVFVDGLWLLRLPAIRALFDLKIFLDTPTNLRRTRRLARDVAERGYTPEAIERQLAETAGPMHDRHVEPQKKWADLVLTQPFQEPEIDALAERLWSLLTKAALVPAWEHATFRADLIDLLANHELCH